MSWRDLFRRRPQQPPPTSIAELLSSGSWAGIRTVRATDGTPLEEPYENLAHELAQLVDDEENFYDGLSPAERDLYMDRAQLDQRVHGQVEVEEWLLGVVEIRRIGHRLNDDGGISLMRRVAERAAVLCQARFALREIESYWHRIGDWQV